MGTASCKNLQLPTQNQQKDTTKNITIGVFGLDGAGKTSIVKAIEGVPTANVPRTINSISTTVANPLNEKTDRSDKNKDLKNIRLIDVSGESKYREKSWLQYYDQIHGLIFVMDASGKKRLVENQEILEDLLGNDKLKNKPVLIFANKQDQKGAINSEYDLKRQLGIEKLNAKYKIEFCTALPQRNTKNKVDESIPEAFSWLIRTIDKNYTELNALVTKAKSIPTTRKFNRSESDENDSDQKYLKEKNTDYRSKVTLEKLPSIHTNKNKTKLYSDDDDIDHNYSSSTKDFDKKKKVLGGTTSNDKSMKKSNDNELKAFRSTFEPFPEETPWSPSSMLKPTKSDDMLPRLYTKPPITNDIKRPGMSPLVHDTRSYTNGSLSKRHNSDDEDDLYGQQKSKLTNRFENPTFSTNKLSSNTKKPTSGIYDDDDDDYNTSGTRRIITTPKKSYNYDDDDNENNYLKKSTTTKSNKTYDFDDNKYPQRSPNRSNLNSEYRGTLSKPVNHSKYDDDDDDDYSKSKPITRSTYNNDYSTSKTTNHSKYNDDDDDDDDDHRWSSSKPSTNSKYDNKGYPSSSSKPISHSKFDDDDDDDYPTSKPTIHSKYNNNDDDDDDDEHDYSKSSKKNTYPLSYGSTGTSRFRKNTDYDS